MIMELLLELASTIALSLLLCHFIFKLASPSSSSPSKPQSFDSDLGDATITLLRGCDFLAHSQNIADSSFGNGVSILGADGVEDEDVEGDENGCTDAEVLEFVDKCVGEKLVEQEISGENFVGEGETAVRQALIKGSDENRCTDEKIIDRVEFGEGNRDFVDGSIGVAENLGSLGEKLVEQEISCENPEEEEEEDDEIPSTEEKIVERAESGGEEVREIENESTDVSEDLGRLRVENLTEQQISDEHGSSLQQECEFFEESAETDNAGEINKCLSDEDDWVGVERTELEKLFGSAMAFVESTSSQARVSILDNDVKKKLYGLRKIATQGPCLEPQPMALKLSARAKWNAWQQLGKMTRETAMEQYISLLSDGVPGWMHGEVKKA